MKTGRRFDIADYKVFMVIAVATASLTAFLIERVLYHFSEESVNMLLSEYGSGFLGLRITDKKYIGYVLRIELRRCILMVLLSFTVLGFPVNLTSLFIKIYRYVFLMVSLCRCGIGKGNILCIAAMCFSLLLCIPPYVYLMGLSYRSLLYCRQNNKRIYHCTKYKLQSEVKICIIILIYVVLECVLETITCGYLLGRMT